MNKVRLYWLLQIGGWMTFAILQIVGYQVYNDTGITSRQLNFFLVEALLLLVVTHGFRTLLIKSGWLAFSFRALIPRVVISVVVLALLVYGLRALVSIPLGIYKTEDTPNIVNILGVSATFMLVLLFWSVFYLIYHYFERYNLSLKRQAEMNEIELNNLKSQLNPHFIFNSLNSIRALIDEDPKKSKLAITQLSTILRSTLVSDQNSLSKFEEELKTVKNYLGLEMIRYEERLKVNFDIDPASYSYQVPPLMLQTLVENGIKHGISQLKEGGEIRVASKVQDGKLHIQIRNSGQLRKTNGKKYNGKSGLGLINTQRRLTLIYGDQAKFKIRNESGSMVLTELILPLNSMNYESADN